MVGFKRHPHPDELDTDEENEANAPPGLRLTTVRTATSTLAESLRIEERAAKKKRRQRSLRFFRRASEKKKDREVSVTESTVDDAPSTPAQPAITGHRRNIYVNVPPMPNEMDVNGEPLARYARNKVRTTKYTILTFVPKNLYEQFRRVANLYFLALVVIQVFPVFGAAGASISFLPLAFIITVTAIKDGIEDYRRAVLDEQVNNSAVTRLGNWRNVNQPRDSRTWFEKLLGLNKPGKITRGVQKLRSREASELSGHIVLKKTGEELDADTLSVATHADDSYANLGQSMMRLPKVEEEPSVYSMTYPPNPSTITTNSTRYSDTGTRVRSMSMSGSVAPRRSMGVIDWSRQTPGSAVWERTLWKKLEVGDIVLLRDNEQIPADIVVLSTGDPDGICYVETKNLDGETNLKPRKSLKATSSIQGEEDIEHAQFILDSEPPHQNLYLFNGVLRYIVDGQTKVEPVTINELLLRGCTVRNTTWIIGLVAFTGSDTKIMLNGGSTPSKRSKIEKETNFNVIMNFVILLLMCTATAIVSGVFDGEGDTSRKFFEAHSDPTSSPAVNAIVTFASCLIAFQNIVPISLYISIEIVKTIQAYFILQDIDMYYRPYDTTCVPKTWNISDDLGQIEYIFSDKTGTLTQNIMEFQKCSVHGISYGEGITEAQKGAAMRDGQLNAMDPEDEGEQLRALKRDMLTLMDKSYQNKWLQHDKVTLLSPKLIQDLVDKESPQRQHIIAFFRALAICHSVLPDRPEPQSDPYLLQYKAESPDEAALVAAARDVGFPFLSRSNGQVEIEVMGRTERYQLLKVLEFNSTRKRMSVIVRNHEGRLMLYCKGADSIIYARLSQDQDPTIKDKTTADMEAFANGGLRTLCISYRYLTEEEYAEWSKVYDTAAAAIQDRDEEIEKASEQIEHSLHILGATALEDKLQEGVPEAIEKLHQAGIKLWILTGDKVQTAIEIGFSCNLLKPTMDVMILSASNASEARVKIEEGLAKVMKVLGPPSLDPNKRGFIPGAQASFAVVIDGDTLRYALEPGLKSLFLNLATQCETVVCCRVSPAQKALTVKLVKDGRNAMTLSIGDGANDVAMIQEANIGCGLFGLEGSQAAMSADYAFGQFRFLTKLLLVHGHWSYLRIADMHGNFFYKNVIWTFAMFWFLPWNSFDATYLYEYTFILLYNLVFTSLPVIALGAFDQDLNAKALLAFPQLYIRGIRGQEYTRTKFWLYMVDGLYQSVVVYFVPYFAWSLGLAISWNGKGIDSLADFGTTVAVAAIIAANTYVGINTHYWTVITWIIVLGSSLVMVLWVAAYSLFNTVDFNNEVVVLYGELTFWTTVVVAVAVSLTPRFLVKFISTAYMPYDRDIVREMWVLGDLKDRLGIKHRKDRRRLPSGSDIERAPMYHQPHQRSASDASVLQHGSDELSPDNILNVPSPHIGRGTAQEDHLLTPSSSSLAPPSVNAMRHMSVSPQPSYYSASDIPPPSPLPSPKYVYYPRQSAAPSSAPTIRDSEIIDSYAEKAEPLPESSRTSDATLAPRPRSGKVIVSEEYEMRIRSPPSAFRMIHSPPPDSGRGPSRVSEVSQYATADEHWTDDMGEDEDDHSTIAPDTTRRDSNYSYTGPHAL